MPNITNFFGLISDADPDDVPGGSSSAQKNVSTHSPGNLVPREGIQPITFSTTATISSSAFNTFQRMCFCRTRLGDLIGVNGLERGFRWDGITTNVEQLGITAPAAAPSISAANLNTADKGKALTSPYVANNGSGLYRITSTSHGLSNGDKVVIGNVVGTGAMQGDLNGVKFTVSGVTTNTFDLVGTIFDGAHTSGGTWSQEGFGATEGIYTFAYRYVDNTATPVYSSLSPATTVTASTNDFFSWSSLSTTTETRAQSQVELYRSTAGVSNVLYRVETISYGGTPAADEVDDDTLNNLDDEDVVLVLLDPPTDLTLVGRRFEPPPTDRPYVVMFQDRYFYLGVVKYDKGTVATGAATATVTITNYTELNSGDKVNLVATDGTNYDFVNGDQSSVNGTWESTTSNNQTATNLANVINTSSGPSGTRFSASPSGAVVTITQSAGDEDGNTTVTLTDSGTAGMSKTNFTGGGASDATLIGYETVWTSDMVGRYVEIAGQVAAVKIASFTSATELELASAVSVSNGTSYVIAPDAAKRRQLLYSEVDEPESVSAVNEITVQQMTNVDDEVVGAIPFGSFLYILGKRHKYALSFTRTPAKDGSVRFVDDRGAFNHYCWDIHESQMYLMDSMGAYVFSGNQSSTISSPLQDLWRQDGSGDKIDMAKSNNFHVQADRTKERIYFFVSFTGDSGDYPTRALVFNVRRKSWDVMEYPVQLGASTFVEKSGRTRVIVGDENEKVELIDEGTTDIISAEVRGTASASSNNTITKTGIEGSGDSNFTSAMVGASIYIYEGTGKGQRRTISSRTTTVATVSANWTTNPDTTSLYVVGAIEWNWKSHRMAFPEDDVRNRREVAVTFKSTTGDQRIDLRFYYNNSSTATSNQISQKLGDAIEIQETNKEDAVIFLKAARSALEDITGREKFRFDGMYSGISHGDHKVAIEFRGFSADDVPEIQSIRIVGVEDGGSQR
tara:strand:+ start:746 stop:3631 length:2886 start_codon:yes stop_codon:yes gene_type:complete